MSGFFYPDRSDTLPGRRVEFLVQELGYLFIGQLRKLGDNVDGKGPVAVVPVLACGFLAEPVGLLAVSIRTVSPGSVGRTVVVVPNARVTAALIMDRVDLRTSGDVPGELTDPGVSGSINPLIAARELTEPRPARRIRLRQEAVACL